MLEIDWKLLLSQTITFLVMVGIVWKLSWKPLLKFIKDRQDTVRQSLENAEKMRLAASSLEEDYQQRLVQVEQQTKDLIALAKLEGNRAKEEIVQSTQKEIADMRKRAEEQLGLQREQIMKDLRDTIITMSMNLTTKIIEDSSLQDLSKDRFNAMLNELDTSKEPARAS
jgi:F-type H+-transporting ATPase subunit b